MFEFYHNNIFITDSLEPSLVKTILIKFYFYNYTLFIHLLLYLLIYWR